VDPREVAAIAALPVGRPATQEAQPAASTSAAVHSTAAAAQRAEPILWGAESVFDWAAAVAREEGRAWLEAAKGGDVASLQRQLAANPRLLLYRGQGTKYSFTGTRPGLTSAPRLLPF